MLVTAVYCGLTFIAGLSMVTQGGIYVFQLFNYYSASGFVLLWVCFFETVVIGWVVGTDNFTAAITLMTGRRISVWFSICWKFLTPAISTGIFVFMLADSKPLKYNKTYEYPLSAQLMGVAMAVMSMMCVLAVFVFRFIRHPGNLTQKWGFATTPDFNRAGCLLKKEKE